MRNIGTFYNQGWTDKWWTLTGSDLGNSLKVDSNVFANGMYISSSAPFEYSEYQEFYPSVSANVNANGYYTLKAKLFGEPSDKLLPTTNASNYYTASVAGLEVYVSGSGVYNLEPQGKLIKTFENSQTINYGEISIDFMAEFTGEITPHFKVNSGQWKFADISLTIMQEEGFSPTEYTYYTEVPTWARNDDLDFKIELYDIAGSKAPIEIWADNTKFSGSNIYIEGGDNIQSGSVYLGNALYSGIESSGEGSAFIRSVGYKGWESASYSGSSGFMMFSGSVLPSEDQKSFASYSGVGIEMHDGLDPGTASYLRFRTDPSLLEVTTDKFFFGRDGLMYISGSGGLLEISSSNFLLSSSGDVYISGSVTAISGTIGGWEISGSTLYSHYYGAGATLTSSIYLDAGDNTIRFHSGSTEDLVLELSGDITEDKDDPVSSFGMFGQDSTIFLKRTSGSFPSGSKSGAATFIQNGTRMKPGFLHLQNSGSATDEWQRMPNESAVFNVVSYNQNANSESVGDTTYGIKVYKNTGASQSLSTVKNYGIYSEVVTLAEPEAEGVAIYGVNSGVGWAGYFSGKVHTGELTSSDFYSTNDLKVERDTFFGTLLAHEHIFTGSVFVSNSLDVDGTISASTISSSGDVYAYQNIEVGYAGGSPQLNATGRFILSSSNHITLRSEGPLAFRNNGANDTSFQSGSTTIMTIDHSNDGNIGIGTIHAPEALTVEGNISASGDLYCASSSLHIGAVTMSNAPSGSLQINTSMQVGTAATTANADNVGTLRYRETGNDIAGTSHLEICMQQNSSTYGWWELKGYSWGI